MDQLKIKREKSFLDPNICADCKFLVGADFGDIEQEISGHKAIFANASPVFNTMFFGSVPENGDPIKVPEIHPETFLTMVNFFYKGEIIIVSLENAVELWYVADKYNIAEFTKYIPDYILKHITPQNVLYIRKSSILYRNEAVINQCNEIILEHTLTVLNNASFLEADISTVNFILEQENINVSEIDLFGALVRYENAQKSIRNGAKSEQPPSTSPAKTVSGDIKVKAQTLSSDGHSNNPCGEGSSNEHGADAQGHIEANGGNPVKELVKKIRFLTMTSKEFVECLGMSSIISPVEALNILVNINDPTVDTHPMPEGYCTMREKRKRIPYYCVHTDSIVNIVATRHGVFSLDFKCSAKVVITGVKVNIFMKSCNYAIEILNDQNQEVLIQSGTFKKSDFCAQIPFVYPVHIDAGSYYTIRVKLQEGEHAQGISYFKRKCFLFKTNIDLDDVNFEFGRNGSCNCQGFFHSIVFST